MRGVKEFSQGFLAGFARAFVADVAFYLLILAPLAWAFWMVT
jgi:hypothetical protein